MTRVAEGPVAATTGEAPPSPHRGDRNNNPPGIGFLALLREDLATNGGTVFEQGYWALAVHRFGNLQMSIRPRFVRLPFTIVYRLLNLFVECAAGISLPYYVRVGRRVRLWHHSGMILHAASIGDDVHIRQNTTFGIASVERNHDYPTIGDRVDIGCGACILGNVTIGDGAKIGANAVVLSDIPPGATAVGMPARVIRRASGEGS